MAEPMRPADQGNAAKGSEVDSFIRRDPRYQIEIPIVFCLPEGRVRGRSINISESGIFAAFEREIELWLTGRLTAQFGDSRIDFSVRVLRIQGRRAGLAFQNLSGKDRAIIRRFLDQSNGYIS
jgi:hypothetical protein